MVTEGKRVTVCRARKLSQDRHTRSVMSVNGRNITRCLRDSERCEAYTEIPELHVSILETIGADQIVKPEREVSARLARDIARSRRSPAG